MAENLTRKLLAEHLVSGRLEPGEEIGLRVDQALLQDATGTMACLQLEQLGQMLRAARAGELTVDSSQLTVTDQPLPQLSTVNCQLSTPPCALQPVAEHFEALGVE